MAMACFRFFTGPALPPGPLLSSPCAYSCMTRPRVLRWLGVGLEEDGDVVMGMGLLRQYAPLSPATQLARQSSRNRTQQVPQLMAPVRNARFASQLGGADGAR